MLPLLIYIQKFCENGRISCDHLLMDLCKLGKDHVQSRILDDDFGLDREGQALGGTISSVESSSLKNLSPSKVLGFFPSGFFLCSFSHNLHQLSLLGKRAGSTSIVDSVQACAVWRKYGRAEPSDENGCFLIRFRWSSVDGRKRGKNASVDEKLFIRFQETENGGFRKRISVDRA